MAVIRLFAAARTAAGTGRDTLPGETVGQVIDAATTAYGPEFSSVLATCQVWLNGEQAAPDDPVGPDDEVAVLPPVSGGCR